MRQLRIVGALVVALIGAVAIVWIAAMASIMYAVSSHNTIWIPGLTLGGPSILAWIAGLALLLWLPTLLLRRNRSGSDDGDPGEARDGIRNGAHHG